MHFLLSPLTRLSTGLALCLGMATFLPIGISYLVLLLFGLLCFSPAWRTARLTLGTHWRWLLLALLVWPALAWLAHGANLDALPRWAHSARMVACLALALTMPMQERKALLLGFGLGSLWAASVAALHHYVLPLPEWDIWHTLLSVKGNASSQKWILLATAVGMGLWLVWQARGPQWLRTMGLALALGVGALVASVSISRNAQLVLAAVPLCLVAYRYRQARAWLLAGLVAVGLTYALWQTLPAVNARFTLAMQELQALVDSGNYSGSVSVRAQMVWTAWTQMWQHPLLGTGLGSWAHIWAEASQRYPDMGGLNNPHNDFALWGMETGLPGLLMLLCLVGGLAVAAWRNPNPLMGGAGWMASIALSITAMVNAPFRDAALGMSLLILAAALATWPAPAQPQDNT